VTAPDGGVNYGISGNVTAQNVAVGPNARIEVTLSSSAVANELEALLDAIKQFDGSPERRQLVEAARDDVVADLGAAEPEKGRILSRLGELAAAAGSAGTIATAATALAGAIGMCF
jgi:hypothetical protein